MVANSIYICWSYSRQDKVLNLQILNTLFVAHSQYSVTYVLSTRTATFTVLIWLAGWLALLYILWRHNGLIDGFSVDVRMDFDQGLKRRRGGVQVFRISVTMFIGRTNNKL